MVSVFAVCDATGIPDWKRSEACTRGDNEAHSVEDQTAASEDGSTMSRGYRMTCWDSEAAVTRVARRVWRWPVHDFFDASTAQTAQLEKSFKEHQIQHLTISFSSTLSISKLCSRSRSQLALYQDALRCAETRWMGPILSSKESILFLSRPFPSPQYLQNQIPRSWLRLKLRASETGCSLG